MQPIDFYKYYFKTKWGSLSTAMEVTTGGLGTTNCLSEEIFVEIMGLPN